MYSKKGIKFELVIPQNNDIDKNLKNAKKERIKLLKANIRKQYEEIYKNQEVEITENNKKIIEDLILATKDLIDNCMKDNNYLANKDGNFINLTYLCHKLDLKLETYKLELRINEINSKSYNIEKAQNDIIKRQNKTEEQSNNLVYNLLGFLASFSIVSASVAAIGEIKGLLYIMIFISFTVLLLLTTLIALHNFYINNDKTKKGLQDNYFLWKMTACIVIALFIVSEIKYIKDNKKNVLSYLDNKIEKVIEQKLNNKEN